MRTRFLVIAAFALLPLSVAASPVKEFHKVFPIGDRGLVTLSSHNGSISVTAWNQPSVGVDARIEEADGSEPEDVQKTEISVRASASEVAIESDYSNVPGHISWLGFGWSHSLPLVHYTIHIPANARLRVSVHNASVKTAGLGDKVEIETHNGSVTLTDIAGSAEVLTHNGNVNAEFARVAAPSRFETHNGDVTVSVPADSKMSVVADAHRGDPLSSEVPIAIRSTGDVLSGAINGGGPELHFSTHNGSLRLRKR